MLEITFSNHAKERLAERGITKEQVAEALTPPTRITSGKGDRMVK